MEKKPLNGDSTIQQLIDHLWQCANKGGPEQNTYIRAAKSLTSRYAEKTQTHRCSELMENNALPIKSLRGLGTKTVTIISDIVGIEPVKASLTLDSTIAELANALWQVDRTNPKAGAYHRVGSALKQHLTKGEKLEFMGQHYDTVGDIIRGGTNANMALTQMDGFAEAGKLDLTRFFVEQGLQPARNIGG